MSKHYQNSVLTVIGAENVTFITKDGDYIVCRVDAEELQGRTMESIFNEGVFPEISGEALESEEKPAETSVSIKDAELRKFCIENGYECNKVLERHAAFMIRCWALGKGKAELLLSFWRNTGVDIGENGDIMLFKGCNSDGRSWHGNTRTIVKEGTVTESGHIIYRANSRVEVEEDSIEGWKGYSGDCVSGLYAGTKNMAKDYGSLIFRCAIRPEDVRGVHDEKLRATALEIHDVWTVLTPFSRHGNSVQGRASKMFRSIPITLLKKLTDSPITETVDLSELCSKGDNIFTVIATLSLMGYRIYQKHTNIYVTPR